MLQAKRPACRLSIAPKNNFAKFYMDQKLILTIADHFINLRFYPVYIVSVRKHPQHNV